MKIKRIFSLFIVIYMFLVIFPLMAYAMPWHENCTSPEYCLVCDVANKVNALPDYEDITLDNAANVQQQLFEIDKIKFDMEDTEYEEFIKLVEISEDGHHVLKYNEAIEALDALIGGGKVSVRKGFLWESGDIIRDVSEAMASFEIVNTETNIATNLSLFTSPLNSYAETSDVYTANVDGWTYNYILPAGTYTITEIGLDKPTIVDGMSFTTGVVYTNGVEGNGTTFEVVEGEKSYVVFNNALRRVEIILDSEAVIPDGCGVKWYSQADELWENPTDVNARWPVDIVINVAESYKLTSITVEHSWLGELEVVPANDIDEFGAGTYTFEPYESGMVTITPIFEKIVEPVFYIDIQSELGEDADGTITILNESGREVVTSLFSDIGEDGFSLDLFETGRYTLVVNSAGLKHTENIIFTYDATTKKFAIAGDNLNDNASILDYTLTCMLEYNIFNVEWVDENGDAILTELLGASLLISGDEGEVKVYDENQMPKKLILGCNKNYGMNWSANFYAKPENSPEISTDVSGDILNFTTGYHYLVNEITGENISALVDYDKNTRTFTLRMVPVTQENIEIYAYDFETGNVLSGVGIMLRGETLDKNGYVIEGADENTVVGEWIITEEGINLRKENIDLKDGNSVKFTITSVPEGYWQGAVDQSFEVLVGGDGLNKTVYNNCLIKSSGDNRINIYFGKEVETNIAFVDEGGNFVEGINVTMVGDAYGEPTDATTWTTDDTSESVTLISGIKYSFDVVTPYGYLINDNKVVLKNANTLLTSGDTTYESGSFTTDGIIFNENVIYIPVITNKLVDYSSVIMKGITGLKDYKIAMQDNYIYLGTKDGGPIKWIVLDSQAGSAIGDNDKLVDFSGDMIENDKGIFLISYEVIDNIAFDSKSSEDYTNVYSDSYIYSAVNNYLNKWFNEDEQKLILATTKNEIAEIKNDDEYKTPFDMNWNETLISGEKLFLPSAKEVFDYMNSERMTITDSENNILNWWTRSSLYDCSDMVGTIDGENSFALDEYVYNRAYTRPAMNINSEMIAFISAVGAKSEEAIPSGEDGKILYSVPSEKVDTWEITLSDESLNFVVESYTYKDKLLTINYDGAKGDGSTYFSVAVIVADGSVTKYGRVQVLTEISGTIEIDMSDVTLNEDEILYVYEEIYTDDVTPDYASELYKVLDAEETKEKPTKRPSSRPTKKDEENEDISGHICPSLEFSDLDVTLWYHEATDYVLEKDMMNGYGDGIFKPGNDLSRAMMVQVLYNLEGRPNDIYNIYFDDVESGTWYEHAIKWAATNNIVNGYENNLFRPEDSITREQMAAILYRYANFKEISVSNQGDLSIFTDANDISKWAHESMKWAVGVKLINGYGNGLVNPIGTATRAEVAQILMNYCKEVIK